jgi:superfamily I DNA/RNA helicase
MDPVDVLRLARTELETAGKDRAQPAYRSVIVDETQDFGAEALRLVRAIAGPERPDDLFLVGDAHQRIYVKPVPLSSCGIQVRGRRSQTLRLNYRTTGAICRWSLSLLSGDEVDDLDEGKADTRGYVSVREGSRPRVEHFATKGEEESAVVEVIKSRIAAGVAPESICVVARTRGPLTDRIAPALERAGIPTILLEKEEPRQSGVRLSTMHRVKGLEFSVVILVSVTKNEVPFPSPEVRSDDHLISSQALLRERALLYVSATRARDELHVFFSGMSSPFLQRSAA